MEAGTSNGALQVTSAGEYPGYKPPEPHTLPSGAVFLLTRPRLNRMIRRGEIPNPLMEIVNQIFVDRDARDLQAEAEQKGIPEGDLVELHQRDDADERQTPPIPVAPSDASAETRLAFTFGELTAWSCIVQPEVEMEPAVEGPLTANGKLSFDALDDADIAYIMAWAREGVEGASRFLAQLASTDAGTDGGAVRDESEPAAGLPA